MHFEKRIVAVGVFVLAASAAFAGDFTVASRGEKASCTIFKASTGATVDFAAAELLDYVKKTTGTELPVTSDAAGADPKIVLSVVEDADLGDDGFLIENLGKELRISGGRRGVLYGVYEVLERFGGVAWFAPWSASVPRLEKLSVPAGYRDRQKPAIPVREVFWTHVTSDPVFSARLRLNNRSWRSDDPRTGGNAWRFGGGLGSCHTFNRLVPPEKYFKDHPEYFSEVGGKRIGERSQLCLTNPDVLRIVTEKVLAAVKADPSAQCFGVSQNDWYNFCTCAKCKAIDDAEGSQAGTMLMFVNKVADAVAAVAPGKMVETLAYQYTRTPPKTVRPRDNVMICLCSIECDFFRPMTASRAEQNVKFRDDIRKWSSLTRKLYIWDYTTNFENYLAPFPNVKSLRENIRFYRDHGAYFLFEQGAHSSWHGEFGELKAWLMSKWMWNPDLPEDELVDRFMKGYYGAAAPFVKEYFDMLYAMGHDEAKVPMKCFSGVGNHASGSDDAFLDRARELWDKAEKAVAGDETRLYNVRTSAMPVDFLIASKRAKRVDLAGGKFPASGREAAKRLTDEMDASARRKRPVYLCESRDKHAKRLKRIREAASGKVLAGDGFTARLQEDMFALAGGKSCRIVDDPAAEGGKALFLANDNYQWYTTYDLNDVAFGKDAEYVLSVRLRADATGKDGEVVQIGVYDYSLRRTLGRRSLHRKHLKDGYADYEVLTWKPGGNNTLYIAPGWFDKKLRSRSAAHDGVWIDSFTVRRKEK